MGAEANLSVAADVSKSKLAEDQLSAGWDALTEKQRTDIARWSGAEFQTADGRANAKAKNAAKMPWADLPVSLRNSALPMVADRARKIEAAGQFRHPDGAPKEGAASRDLGYNPEATENTFAGMPLRLSRKTLASGRKVWVLQNAETGNDLEYPTAGTPFPGETKRKKWDQVSRMLAVEGDAEFQTSVAEMEQQTAARKQRDGLASAPKEGDTKTESGVTYELRGGRWHRTGEEKGKEGPFGPVFAGFKNQPEKAIERLRQEKRGEVPDAFLHPELGPIAFVYGDKNMGLKHIEDKRGRDFVDRIPDVLPKGRVVRDEKLPQAYCSGRGTQREKAAGPGRPVDDPFVLAGLAAVLVGDLADIDSVVQQPVDVGGVPFGALAHLVFLGGPGLGAVTLFVQFLTQLLGRADLDEAAEDVLHRPGFIGSDQQLLVVPVDVVPEDGYAAAVCPPALGCRHLVPDRFGDDLPLVLGEGDQDAEKHPAGGIGGAEIFRPEVIAVATRSAYRGGRRQSP
jgi:hypothetical protein